MQNANANCGWLHANSVDGNLMPQKIRLVDNLFVFIYITYQPKSSSFLRCTADKVQCFVKDKLLQQPWPLSADDTQLVMYVVDS